MDDHWTPLIKEDVFFAEPASPGVSTYVYETLNSSAFQNNNYGVEGSEISPCSSSSFLPSPESLVAVSPERQTQNGYIDLDSATIRYVHSTPVFETAADFHATDQRSFAYVENTSLPSAHNLVKAEHDDDSNGSRPHSHFSAADSYVCLRDENGDFGDLDQYICGSDGRELDGELFAAITTGTTAFEDARFGHQTSTYYRSGTQLSITLFCLIFVKDNTRHSGTLMLSAEEKRTLMQEGYELPTALPLSREQEEALKLVRRKIKNKLSAMESRRKKKEYVTQLEKKLHSFYSETVTLRQRLKSVEQANRDLLAQLKSFQSPTSIDAKSTTSR
ncbi:BZIP domain-containing protein [Aphelenchoides besseyi]|nr:BZIP domain-containing protein [Aphelenchoides besseyi]